MTHAAGYAAALAGLMQVDTRERSHEFVRGWIAGRGEMRPQTPHTVSSHFQGGWTGESSGQVVGSADGGAGGASAGVCEAPGHTDLMVTPESLDAWLEANPPEVGK